jgi:putative salt-induced outer membrane protein
MADRLCCAALSPAPDPCPEHRVKPLPILLFSVLLAFNVHADDGDAVDATDSGEPAAPTLPEVSGTLGVGALSASGNTESRSLNVDVAAQVAYEVWRHKVQASGYQASEDGTDTADRFKGSVQSDYRFSERSYLFANGSYESDRFGAFDRQASVSAGLGRRVLETPSLSLDLEAGAGHRVSEPDGTNDRDGEGIARLNGDLAWKFSENGQFTQELEVISGSSNTATESISTLRSRLMGDLSWRLSHTIVHNSDVPSGTEKTDTFTVLAVEYAF